MLSLAQRKVISMESWTAIRPFMLPRRGPATEGERAALRLPRPNGTRSGSILRRPPEPPRRNPGESEWEGK